MFANTPSPPYYAVIFSSILNKGSQDYNPMSEKMILLAQQQEGFLGMESARSDLGITVSYWKDLESIKVWKQNEEHLIAQKMGKTNWYREYKVRIAKVERDYSFDA